MPDDATEEITEQENDDLAFSLVESEAAFDEAAADESEFNESEQSEKEKKPEKEPEAKKPEKEPEKTKKEKDEKSETTEKDEKGEGEKAETKDEEKEPEKELTAQEAIDQRLKEIEEEKKPDETDKDEKKDKEEPEKKPEKAADENPPARAKWTKENVQQHLNLITDDELPDGEIVIGDSTIDLKELKKDDPETFDAIKVVSSVTAGKYVNGLLRSGHVVTAKAMNDFKEEMLGYVGGLNFWMDVLQQHPDARQIENSDNYKAWLEKQSDGIKTMAEGTPPDFVKVLNLFKEQIAQADADKHDDKLDKEKQKTDALHKSSMKPAASSKKSPKPKADKGDDEAAFDEFADRED